VTTTPGEPETSIPSGTRALLDAGRFTEARHLLDRAAAAQRRSGNEPGAAEALHLAALVSRIMGDPAGAQRRASSAAFLAPRGSRAAVGAETELAEVAAAQGRFRDAATSYREALRQARAGGRGSDELLRLVARQAQLLAQAGDAVGANRAFQEVTAFLGEAGDDRLLWAEVAQAAALQAGSRPDAAAALSADAARRASGLGNHAAVAELALLDVARALEHDDVERAARSAAQAQAESLEAVNPLTYLVASVSLSELADRRGDRLQAYETMATALATLGDLIGRPQARALAEPQLLALRDRWGPVDFAAVKARHDDRRRAAMRGGPPG
jgi:hypothetical protein